MRRSLQELRPARFRTRILRLVLAGFVCRALIPVGFMPAPLGAGGPVVICHGGAMGAFLEAFAEARHATTGLMHGSGHADHASHGSRPDHEPSTHDSDAEAEHDGWEHCPVGAAYASAPLSHQFSLSLLSLEHVYTPTEPAAAPDSELVSPYRARGPPRSPFSRQLS